MSAVTTLIWDRRYQNTTVKRIKDAAIEKRQRTRQQNIADNEDILMREEEAWRHIQEPDVDNEEEEDGETVPTSRLELSRKRPQEFTGEQKENKDDHLRPITTRRLEKGPSQPTESQQESASNSKGSRKRTHMDTAETEDTHNLQHYAEDHPPFTRQKLSVEIAFDAVADESQETDRHVDPFDQWYEDVTEMPETP